MGWAALGVILEGMSEVDDDEPEPEIRPETGDASRGADGRFVPGGGSGNPKGRPKKAKEVQDYALEFSFEAVDVLAEIMRNAKSVKERRQAAVNLLDRACGKPSQPLTDGDGGPLIPATKAAAIEALRAVMPTRAPTAPPASTAPPTPEPPAGG